jgi:hypothetical protein
MAVAREKWTRISEPARVELPRSVKRYSFLFVSPAGIFLPDVLELAPGASVTVHFSVSGRPVTAHAEVRRLLEPSQAAARGIDHATEGTELRIVRMEGDGSSILAEHIKKVLMESGGPAGQNR